MSLRSATSGIRKAGLSAGLLLLALVTLATTAPSTSPTACTVDIAGPNAVTVGGTIELVATGSPSGGTYRWMVSPRSGGPRAGRRLATLANANVAFRAKGPRLEVTGVAPSAALRDVRLTVHYTVGADTCTSNHRITVASGNVTAYRPQHGAAYFPMKRTAVAEGDEESPTLGPGIRINAPGDTDPAGEDDLIELRLEPSPPGQPFVLHRTGTQLSVWTTRARSPGTEIAFSGSQTGVIPGATTVWVEWASSAHGTESLELRPQGSPNCVDRATFHTFRSIVAALGGEDQVPSIPVDPNHGTFVVGIALYELGYDVHLHDEDNVAPNGSGPVYDEIVTAVQDRGVSQIVSFGYSHGGGSTYDLAERLDTNQGTIGSFTIPYTSYVDGIENDSDSDLTAESRLPPLSGVHVNHFQNGTLADFFLDGTEIPGSIPPPDGLDVETTVWGSGATHFLVDDYSQVRDYIEAHLLSSVDR